MTTTINYLGEWALISFIIVVILGCIWMALHVLGAIWIIVSDLWETIEYWWEQRRDSHSD